MPFVKTKDGVNIFFKDWGRKTSNRLFSIMDGR